MSDVPPKSANAFRTIGEVAEELGVAQHVLRFWETRFPQVQPLKRGGNRRYYRPADVELLRDIHRRLHAEGYTIKGVQKLLAERGRGAPKPAAELPAISGEGTPVPDAAPDMAPPVDLGAIRQVRDRLAAALAAARAA